MGVKIHAVQDEMPEGMERVLNILEQVAKAEVKPYNAVKQISGTRCPVRRLPRHRIRWRRPHHVLGLRRRSGYGSTETIDFVPDVTESSAWLQWQISPIGPDGQTIASRRCRVAEGGWVKDSGIPTTIRRSDSKYIQSENGNLPS